MDFKLHDHLALGNLNSILELLRMDWPMKRLLVVWLALARETTAWEGPGTGWHPTSSRGMPRNLRSLWPRHCHANFSSYSLPLSLGTSAFIKGHRQGLSRGWSLMLHVSAYSWHQFPPLSLSILSGGNARKGAKNPTRIGTLALSCLQGFLSLWNTILFLLTLHLATTVLKPRYRLHLFWKFRL